MNYIFLTQGNTLSTFFEMAQIFAATVPIEKVGFYISSSLFFQRFEKEYPAINSIRYELLKEWEIIEDSEQINPNLEKLKGFENKYGDPFLWNAIVADRRIYLGKRASLEQDYSSRFTHERMLAILEVGIERMEALFDKVQPDAVIGFICVTIGEYLAYLIARSRGIPFINLRPARIQNYIYAGESITDTSKRLNHNFRKQQREGIPGELREKIDYYLKDVRSKHVMYEGVIPASKAVSRSIVESRKRNKVTFYQIIKKLWKLTNRFYQYNFGKYRHDNSFRGVFYPLWFYKIKRPIRIILTDLCLKKFYINRQQLKSINYAFFPLHSEPEVTLSVWGRSCLNQIEVIRNIARSLPAGMKLVVKEHPVSVGKRSLSYYKKILDIPGVVLASPYIEGCELVENARLVSIISGTIGLEALMMKKPVIYFGNVSFGIMPDSMIRHINDLDKIGWEISDLLNNHKHDEEALIAYIATIMQTSVPVDFYSQILQRQEVYDPTNTDSDLIKNQNINNLSKYILDIIGDQSNI